MYTLGGRNAAIYEGFEESDWVGPARRGGGKGRWARGRSRRGGGGGSTLVAKMGFSLSSSANYMMPNYMMRHGSDDPAKLQC